LAKITVLTVANGLATKTVTPQGPKDNSPAKYNYFEENEVNSIFELSTLLKHIEQDPRRYIIRGEPTEHVRPGMKVRRIKNAQPDGTPPSFREVARPYLMVDIDELEAPSSVNPVSLDAVEYAISKLPEEFRHVSTFFQFSANAGLKGQQIKLHLWYWLDRPVTDSDLRHWAKDFNQRIGTKLVDPALYHGVQSHFIAAPILEGIPDPVQERSGLIVKENHTVEIHLPAPEYVKIEGVSGGGALADYSLDDILNAIGDHPGGEGFHAPLRNASWQLVREFGIEARAQIKETLRDATRSAFKASHRGGDIDRYTSDLYLDDLIDGASEKQAISVRRILPDVEPYFVCDEVEAEEGTHRLTQLLQDFFQRPRNMAIRITTGAGKTSTFVSMVARESKSIGPGYIFVPTHRLAREIYARFASEAGDLPVAIIEGRNSKNCRAFEKVNAIMDAGLPVGKSACITKKKRGDGTYEEIKCRFYDQCKVDGYQSQFSVRAAVVIFVHNHLTVDLAEGIRKPDWIMIDESFFNVLIDVVEVSTEDLIWGPMHKIGPTILEHLRNGSDVLEALERVECGIEDLEEIKRIFYAQWKSQFNEIDPSVDDGRLLKNLRPINSAVHVVSEMINAMKDGRPNCRRIRLQEFDGGFSVVVARKNPLLVEGPTLMLDATADEAILSRIFDDVEFHRIDVRQNMHVTQVIDHRLSKTALLTGRDADRNLARCQKVIDTHKDRYKSALVVTYKSVKEALRLPSGWSIEHFGGLRGLNQYKDVDAVFIFGNNRPPIHHIENFAVALADDDEHLKLDAGMSESIRGYRTSVAKKGVMTPVHADALCQAILEQCRESETMQAIGRARAVHGRKGPVHIYIVSSIPVDVTVNRFLTLDELAEGGSVLERLMTRFHGVIPLSPAWLAENASDIFRNGKQAKNWLSRNWAQLANNIYSEESLIEGSYRKKGQKGANPTRFVTLTPHLSPRAMLEEKVGELKEYDGPEDTHTLHYWDIDGHRYYYHYGEDDQLDIPGFEVYRGSEELMRFLNDNEPMLENKRTGTTGA